MKVGGFPYIGVLLQSLATMRNLFTKLYLQFLASFVVALLVIGLSVSSLARFELTSFAKDRLEPVAELAEETWQALAPEEREAWLAIISTLSGTQWQLVTEEGDEGYRIDDLSLQSSNAVVTIWLDEDVAAKINIRSWSDWEEVMGWLVLSDLSNLEADFREARFQQLKLIFPFEIDRVNRSVQMINTLQLRQLNNGQAVRVTHEDSNQATLYFPAGANQVIRIGPVDRFEFLSTVEWMLIILMSLITLSLIFSLWVRPLHRRFMELHRTVGRIGSTESSVNLPVNYDDQFGDLASRIQSLALNLIAQVDANKQLNLAVSHDLKTPLARIKFALALIEDAEANPYLEQINQDVTLLNELISELLLYHQLVDSRAHAGSCEGVTELHQRLERIPSAIGQILAIPDRAIVPVSSTDWRRIVNNLLGNAEEYGKSILSVRLETTPLLCTLVIEDDGPGLTSEEFERLRLPFQRVSKHRELDKSHHGLGLSLVDATVKHYGGLFSCESGELGGAKFVISLPYNAQAA